MSRFNLTGWKSAVVTVLAVSICPLTASAISFSDDTGDIYGSFDTTLSLGASWRMQRQSADIIGIANGGTAFSVNGDDGNLNYPKRSYFSRAAKITSELEFNYKNFGTFIRGTYFYDFEVNDEETGRTPLSQAALDASGEGGDLLDAFVWYKFDLFDRPAEIRLGEQVVNWGESTFIQNGNNVINHINVSALRVPGAELREALLPQDLVWFSVGLSDSLELEMVYQYDWDDTEPDAVGTYFGTNDFVPDGGSEVRLAFGDTPDFPNPPAFQAAVGSRGFNSIPRGPTGEPEDGGQYGAALRWYLSDLNNGTELGFYYYKYHSRLPLISARTGSFEGLQAAAAFSVPGGAVDIATAALTYIAMNPGDVDGAIQAGIDARNPGVAEYAANDLARIAATGGNWPVFATAFATDAFANTPAGTRPDGFALDDPLTSYYFTSFPEDIDMFGVSFNTTVGQWAWQGEWSHHKDKPFQVDDLELLFAGLSPLRDQFGQFGQLGSFSFNSISPQFNADTPPLTTINGFRRLDYSQVQATATRLFGPVFGGDQAAFLFEGALSHVHRMPEKDVLRFNGPGTYVSGNPPLEDVGHAGKPFETNDKFADATSYGYRLAGFIDYNNALGPINLSPRFSWQHDLRGITPGPGGNFIAGRKALTLGVRGTYQNRWEANLLYTEFWGAGRYNLIHDRDFMSANIKFTF